MKRIRQCGVGVFLLALVACSRRPSEEENEQLAAKQTAEAPVTETVDHSAVRLPSTAPAAAEPQSAAGGVLASTAGDTSDAVRLSLEFLKEADRLMGAVKPELPEVEKHESLLRCVTSQTPGQDIALSRGADALRARERASAHGRKTAAEKFWRGRFPLNYRIDVDWEERRDPKNEAIFLYSGSAKGAPPILMQQLEQANITIPAALSCRVGDYRRSAESKTWEVECLEPKGLVIVTQGEPPELHRTDVISAPLAGESREPNGVLYKQLSDRSGSTGGTWRLAAYGAALEVQQAECPTASDVLAKVEELQTRAAAAPVFHQ